MLKLTGTLGKSTANPVGVARTPSSLADSIADLLATVTGPFGKASTYQAGKMQSLG
jgi:hypothetical protein